MTLVHFTKDKLLVKKEEWLQFLMTFFNLFAVTSIRGYFGSFKLNLVSFKYKHLMFHIFQDSSEKSDKFVTGWEFGPNVKLSQRKTDDFGCGSVCRRWVSRWDGNCEVISMYYSNRQTAWSFKLSPTIFRIFKRIELFILYLL